MSSGGRKSRIDDAIVVENVPVIRDDLILQLGGGSHLTSSNDLLASDNSGANEGTSGGAGGGGGGNTNHSPSAVQQTVDVVVELCAMFGPVRQSKPIIGGGGGGGGGIVFRPSEESLETIAVEVVFAEKADAASAVDSLQGVLFGDRVLSCRYKTV